MRQKLYFFFFTLVLFSGCAITYKSQHIPTKQPIKEDLIDTTLSSLVITKEPERLVLNDARLNKQISRKGYRSYKLSISNYTNDTVWITAQNLIAIEDHLKVPFLLPNDFLNLINMNRGLYLTTAAYGLISPFAYAGSKISFSKAHLIVALPLLAYGAANTIVAKNSYKKIKKDINEQYIVGKMIPPYYTVYGFVVMKRKNDDFEFVYRK